MLGRIVLFFVDPQHDGLDLALARSGDQHLFGPGRQVSLGLIGMSEQAGGLDHQLHPQVLPGQLGGILGGHNAFDLVAVDDNDVILGQRGIALGGGNLSGEFPVDRIVFKLVGEILGVGGDIHHRHHVQGVAQYFLFRHSTDHQAADPAETVDTDFYTHSSLSCVLSFILA